MASVYDPEANEITSPQRISQLLKQLHEKRSLLSIFIPGYKGSNYTSAIIAIDSKQHFLILDELNPETGHQRLLKVKHFRASTSLDRVQVRFKGTVESVGGENGVGYYRVPLPDSVYYAQRREHFRINLRLKDHSTATLHYANNIILSGQVVNLSSGGAGILIPEHPLLESGTYFPDCHIQLPNSERLSCPVSVCHIKVDEETGRQLVGISFSGLERPQEQMLQRSIVSLQRRLLKNE